MPRNHSEDQGRDARRGKKPRPRPRQRTAASGTRSGTANLGPRRAPSKRKPARQQGSRSPARGNERRRPLTRRQKILRVLGLATITGLLLALVGGGIAIAAISRSLPDPSDAAKGRDQTSLVYDRNGALITKLFAEQNRTDKPLADIPLALRQGVIATEDQRYYEHAGVDPWGLARALWVDVTQGKRHGGSTITQQYVKNAFVTPERTLTRKIKEALLAYRVEKDNSKDDILQLYLNTIYFGHGAYGVEAASQVYFGTSVENLSLAQSAMIAGVLKSPGIYSPYLDPEAARARRDTVLAQMFAEGYIDRAAHDAAVAEEVAPAGLPETSSLAPYFMEYVKAQLVEEYGAEAVYRGGITVKTTLDLKMQRAAEQAIAETLDLEGDPSAALVALDPKTGEILAMVGGRDFATQQFNVAVQGKRQPGSAFKTFVLAAALEQGVLPEQLFESQSASFSLPNGQTWKVTGSSGGPSRMRLRQATEKSVNSVFAKLILDIGAERVVQTAEALGVHAGIAPVPAIALGGLEQGVSPLEMASAYGTLAAGGVHAQPFGISEVSDAGGQVVFSAEAITATAIDPAVAYLTTDLLRGVIDRGTGTGAKIGRPAAGKTGTTQEYRDAWFVGYTPQIAAAVWVGHPDGQIEMKDVHGRAVTGGSFPATIWKQFMTAAMEGMPEEGFKRPSGLVGLNTCTESGRVATEWCTDTFVSQYLLDHRPGYCDVHTGPEKIEIPNLIGMTKEKALALLKELMLLARVIEQDVPGIPVGVVSAQTPAPRSMGTTETIVELTVSNGGSADIPPTAKFEFGPAEPTVGQSIAFNAAPSKDDGTITLYFWEFGDGSSAEGRHTAHAYASQGTYEVTLWVTDDKDQTSSVTQSITIK
jgi:penicillin-binding protein 1A